MGNSQSQKSSDNRGPPPNIKRGKYVLSTEEKIKQGLLAPRNKSDAQTAVCKLECPICFMNFEFLNNTRCCQQVICTDCFLDVQPQMKNECPFCSREKFQTSFSSTPTESASVSPLITKGTDNDGVVIPPANLSTPNNNAKSDAKITILTSSVSDRQSLEQEISAQHQVRSMHSHSNTSTPYQSRLSNESSSYSGGRSNGSYSGHRGGVRSTGSSSTARRSAPLDTSPYWRPSPISSPTNRRPSGSTMASHSLPDPFNIKFSADVYRAHGIGDIPQEDPSPANASHNIPTTHPPTDTYPQEDEMDEEEEFMLLQAIQLSLQEVEVAGGSDASTGVYAVDSGAEEVVSISEGPMVGASSSQGDDLQESHHLADEAHSSVSSLKESEHLCAIATLPIGHHSSDSLANPLVTTTPCTTVIAHSSTLNDSPVAVRNEEDVLPMNDQPENVLIS